MPEPELSFEDAYKELTNWARSLLTTIEGSLPEIRDSLDPSTKLPENCPSHASLALLVFGQVRKKLAEVNGFAKMVDDAIRKTG